MAVYGKLLAVALTATAALLGGCADDPDQTVDAGSPVTQKPGATPAGIGVVTVQLEPVEGVFIEGFEVGLRFETGDGDVLGSTLWTDYINERFTDPSTDDYYGSVLRQDVPAGPVVVLATVNIGAGPPPEIPDVAGDLRCRLGLDVPPDGEVAVEINFDGGDDCLREMAPPKSAPGQPGSGQDLHEPELGREITFDGVGGVQLGDVLDPSEVTPYEGRGSCGYWGPNEPSPDGVEPLGGLVSGADTATPTVLSIMVRRNGAYRTTEGVGFGTSLDTLTRVYGDDLVVDRADGWENATAGLHASYLDVAAVANGDDALTFYLVNDTVDTVKVSPLDFWGDDEGCA